MGVQQHNTNEYHRDYPKLNFRVFYSYNSDRADEICFAGQPYEHMEIEGSDYDSDAYMIYGRLNASGHLQIGYKSPLTSMTKDLHGRIGKLYDMIGDELIQQYDGNK